jgi:hypothetical protein
MPVTAVPLSASEGALFCGQVGSFTLTGSHTYQTTGTFPIGVTLKDDGAGTATAVAVSSAQVSFPAATKTLLGMTVNASQNGNGTVLSLQTYTSPNGSSTTGMLSFLDSRLSHWPAVLLLQKSTFTSVVCTGPHQASVFGTGTSNGAPVTFLISVAASQAVTGGDPLPNTYQIRLSNGYISGVIGTQSSWFIGC